MHGNAELAVWAAAQQQQQQQQQQHSEQSRGQVRAEEDVDEATLQHALKAYARARQLCPALEVSLPSLLCLCLRPLAAIFFARLSPVPMSVQNSPDFHFNRGTSTRILPTHIHMHTHISANVRTNICKA
jgi:hypothetical protein